MRRTHLLMVAWLGLVLGAAGCGRSELDAPFGTTYATTGSAANVDPTGTGTAGNGGTGSGAGGAPGVPPGASTPPSLTPIPCGDTVCKPGIQICCVQRSRRQQTETCIGANASCDSGASIGCVGSGSCGAGTICCESLLSPMTMCVTAQACVVEPGVILCDVSSDCPASAPHCCQTEGTGICAAQACPAGGQQGPDGVGVGGPQD